MVVFRLPDLLLFAGNGQNGFRRFTGSGASEVLDCFRGIKLFNCHENSKSIRRVGNFNRFLVTSGRCCHTLSGGGIFKELTIVKEKISDGRWSFVGIKTALKNRWWIHRYPPSVSIEMKCVLSSGIWSVLRSWALPYWGSPLLIYLVHPGGIW